jgi:hypothetical protein
MTGPPFGRPACGRDFANPRYLCGQKQIRGKELVLRTFETIRKVSGSTKPREVSMSVVSEQCRESTLRTRVNASILHIVR